MAKYLVIHPVGPDLTPEAGAPIGKAIKAGLTADAYWTMSEYVPEQGRLYCRWDAKDAESILQVLAQTAPDLPTEGPYEIGMVIQSEDYR
jgi:hypothetical protein